MQQRVSGSPLILTAQQMRMSDRHVIEELGISGEQLMERAGAAVADVVVSMLEQNKGAEPVLVLAGPGNNGGDGFAAAMHLLNRDIRVRLALLGSCERLQGDAATHARRAAEQGLELAELDGETAWAQLNEWLQQAGTIVDALFGTGLSRPPSGDGERLIDLVNSCRCPTLAVDIASGVDSDSGVVPGKAVQATWTLPIAASKWGHWLGEGRQRAGTLLPPADIGISDEVMLAMQAAQPGPAASARLITHGDLMQAELPQRYDMHKRDFGHLWIFGGSTGYTGAPRLAAAGALAMDAGLVSIACPDEAYAVIAASSLEVMVHPQAVAPWQGGDAVVAGPGWGRAEVAMLKQLLAADMPLLLDADALNMVAMDAALARLVAGRQQVTVLTPHPGEAGRLLSRPTAAVQADRPAAIRDLAERFRAWVVLKGASTLVASPGIDIQLCPFGSTALARGGTGDVLAGMIGSLLARYVPPDRAVPAAVGLHALAGEGEGWCRAGELPDAVFALRRRLRESV